MQHSKRRKNINQKATKQTITMRVLFYTAAAIAATIASLGQAVKLETSTVDDYTSDYNEFSQIDVFAGQVN